MEPTPPTIPTNFDELSISEKILALCEVHLDKKLEQYAKIVYVRTSKTETWYFREDSWVGPRGQVVTIIKKE